MAESAVSFLVNRIGTLLEDELRLLGGIKGEFAVVRNELELMRAFLQEADSMEDVDEGLRAWVKLVRELAFNAEDVIDDFLLRFERPKQSGVFRCLSKTGRAVTTLKARRQVAAELRNVKSNAVELSAARERHTPYWKSEQRGAQNKLPFMTVRRDDARLVPEDQLIAIETRKKHLISCLLEDNEERVKVIAVYGMEGLGKTTLVNQVYTDPGFQNSFKLRVWITISQTFVERSALQKIVKQLYEAIELPVPEATASKDSHSLKKDIQSLLRNNKYLIVLNNVQTPSAWESLKYAFPNENSSSRLVVTTCVRSVADLITKNHFAGEIYEMPPLTSEESWDLFCARAFQGQPCPRHLEEDSLLMLEKCKGLPALIISVCELLAKKDAKKDEWQTVGRNVEAELYGSNHLKVMEYSLGFNDLPYYLKSCLLYLSMFPENCYYEKQYMVQLWIAEGFAQETGNATAEEVGDGYFNYLLNSERHVHMVEEDHLGKDYCQFRVHNHVREILLRKSESQNFATTVKEQRLQQSIRRLSVDTSLERLGSHCNLSKLRSLIFVSSEGSDTSSVSLSKFLEDHGITLLRVLDCSRLALDKFPKLITAQYNLTYLNLSSTKVLSVPRSIRRLKKLQTLSLINTLVDELPVEILEIHSLRHLMAYREISEGSPRKTTFLGVKVPAGIGKLTCLQTLFVIQVTQPTPKAEVDLIRSLGELKQLRDLRIQQVREEYKQILCSSIEKMVHLRTLKMESGKDDEILDVQHISSPPPSLKVVAMHGHLVKLPSWVCNRLESLTCLSLKWSRLTVDPLDSLQNITSLEVLEFTDEAYDGDELCFKAGGFQMLKILWFQSLSNLKRVTVERGAMPDLKTLSLKNCKLLEEVPSGVEFLTNLKKLYVVDMGDQFARRLRSSSAADSDFRRIKHVPSLVMGSFV